MARAILFKRCLGFNDARATTNFKAHLDPRDPEAGSTELIDCLNLTTTPDGCLEKLPPLVSVVDTLAPITRLSAGQRMFFSDGTNTKEWTGSAIVNRFPAHSGPIAHTPIDVRVSAAAKNYKSLNPSSAEVEAVVGTYSGPTVLTPFYAMPLFKQAFVYNKHLYAVNATDPRFLQYSHDYHYDLWPLGDNFLPHATPILQAGAIPGVLLTTHAGGVTVWSGTGPADFVKKFYPCQPLNGTLWSGLISKVYGYGHVFLAADGVYSVSADGQLVNMTVGQTDDLTVLNASYCGSVVQDGKYVAYGNLLGLEYDFITKTLLKRTAFSVTAACQWNGQGYVSVANSIMAPGSTIDSGDTFGCSLSLPYTTLGASGTKSMESLYFTGTMTGEMEITVTDQEDRGWMVTVSDELVNVTDYRIKTPKGKFGNHASLRIECLSGAFRMEQLTAVVFGSNRSR